MTTDNKAHVTVIGAGLAGCEAAYQIAQRGINVTLYEMKPLPQFTGNDRAKPSGVGNDAGLTRHGVAQKISAICHTSESHGPALKGYFKLHLRG